MLLELEKGDSVEIGALGHGHAAHQYFSSERRVPSRFRDGSVVEAVEERRDRR